ncbi:MAG: hypothetical protein ACI9E4_000654 [Pseudohongiellaceae bacterium]|jgi:uncharacterized protein (TIGR02099 family)
MFLALTSTATDMVAKIFKKLRQQTVIVTVVAVVLMAAYVSIGRQFMPAVSQYTEFFEQQLSAVAGVPVSIEKLTGSFSGFNPILQIDGLNLKVSDGQESAPPTSAGALYFSSATIELDVPKSIWRRQWVLQDFRVESLEINVEQTTSGSWQLQGMSVDAEQSMELATVYDALLRISRLDMSGVGINIETQNGGRFRFNDGAASIRNQDAKHYIHATAFPDRSRAEVKVSLEAVGAVLSDMSGQLHVDIPVGNYSELAAGEYGDQLTLTQLLGGAGIWLDLERGRPTSLIVQPQISRLAFKGPYSEGTTLQQFSGIVSVDFDETSVGSISQLDLSDMHMSWNGINWLNFNSSLSIKSEQDIAVVADRVNIDLLSGVALASGFLPAEINNQLRQYSPKGAFENLNIIWSLADDKIKTLALSSNVRAVAASAVGGSPNLAGIDGFVELEFDASTEIFSGVGEIESTNFSMSFPNIFSSTWDYSHANGALDFLIDISDGQEIRLSSSVIVAESDAVDARAQFASYLRRYPDGLRESESELDLYVGASRLDGQQKNLYLPDGPSITDNLRNTMQWLDEAELSGDVTNAGIIYRGSTLPGASAELKTFQSYFEMERGQLRFSEAWPEINDLSALVLTADNDVDLEIRAGRSLNLSLDGASGKVRRNLDDENWINIAGNASGLTSDGLTYLQNAGVGEDLKEEFSSWQAAGDFKVDVDVNIPLGVPDAETKVRLEMAVLDNQLTLPEYSLTVSQLSGPVIFDTETGVEETTLSGNFFGRPANFTLSSLSREGELEAIYIDSTGMAAIPELIEWPMQSDFIADLLRQMSGEFNYTAKLNLNQSSAANSQTFLSIQTDLKGASSNFPEPFGKAAQETRPLVLNFGFGENQSVDGRYGESLNFQMDLKGAAVTKGVVYVGSDSNDLTSLLDSDAPGLVVLGEIPIFNLEQWTSFLDSFGGQGANAAPDDFRDSLALVDVSVNNFELYDQILPSVAMRIEASQKIPAWTVRLVSENILGQVDIPFSENDYLLLNFEYLRLPGDADVQLASINSFGNDSTGEDMDVSTLQEEIPIDALVSIDPRTLPKMKFTTEDFSIGSRPYGPWQFTLDASEKGAELTDLAFDFRGLRLGFDDVMEDAEDEGGESVSLKPHFLWLYDGVNHRSELQGLLHADNMADVLSANGLTAVFESSAAVFTADIQWPGSPAFFAASGLSGELDMEIRDGRFFQDANGKGVLKLISIINVDAIMRRLQISDDLLNRGLAYDEISARFSLKDGLVDIKDRLVISGPSSLYQITGGLDLGQETISGELYVTLPLSRNIPWIGLLTANIPLAVGAYLFDRIFGDQVDSLTSAVYTLEGPWEGLEPEFKQAFGSPASAEPD